MGFLGVMLLQPRLGLRACKQQADRDSQSIPSRLGPPTPAPHMPSRPAAQTTPGRRRRARSRRPARAVAPGAPGSRTCPRGLLCQGVGGGAQRRAGGRGQSRRRALSPLLPLFLVMASSLRPLFLAPLPIPSSPALAHLHSGSPPKIARTRRACRMASPPHAWRLIWLCAWAWTLVTCCGALFLKGGLTRWAPPAGPGRRACGTLGLSRGRACRAARSQPCTPTDDGCRLALVGLTDHLVHGRIHGAGVVGDAFG